MKKKYIILITIIIIYFIALFLIFGLDKIKKDKLNSTIIIDNSSIFKQYKNKWSSLDNYNVYNYNDFKMYLDNKNIGVYKLLYDEKWYLLDKNNKPVNKTYNSLLAIDSNYNIKVKDFNYTKNNNLDVVNRILKDNNISGSVDLTSNFIYKVDIDNDDIVENIYCISNAFSKNIDSSIVFSFVVMEKNNELIYLFREKLTNDGFTGCKPYINKIIDVDLDDKYEIILSCGRYSKEKKEDYLYKYDKNKFSLLISNN